MKRMITAIAAITMMCVCSVELHAQESTQTSAAAKGATFGIRAGVNFFNINGKDEDGEKLDNKLKPGFNAGVTVDIPFGRDFYFQPGLLFSTKGAKQDLGDETGKLTLNYLELPLNFVYKAPVGTGAVLLGAGPYAAYGIGGKYKVGDESADVKFKKEPENGGADDAIYFKPFDAGLNLLVGYEFTPNISLQLNAQLGLANINAYDDDAKLRNTGYGVSVGLKL